MPQSYRAISLLNVDAKFYLIITASHLVSILPCLIHFVQAGFVKGSTAISNIHKVITDLEHANPPPGGSGYYQLRLRKSP